MIDAPIAATGIDCTCYLAKDLERAKRFYIDVIGLRPSAEADNWVEFELADGTTFGIAKLPGDTWYPGGGVMFAVPNVARALERVRAAGVTVGGDGIMDTPVCEMAWCTDTEGNGFALHKRKTS